MEKAILRVGNLKQSPKPHSWEHTEMQYQLCSRIITTPFSPKPTTAIKDIKKVTGVYVFFPLSIVRLHDSISEEGFHYLVFDL